MANKNIAKEISEALDKLEAEAENIKPIDDVLVEAAKAYVKTALHEQYEMTLSSDALMEDIWNGYDLLDAFKAGVEWKLKKVVNKMYNVGYSYDSIAEALGIECADVVDMLDFDE